MTRVVLDDFHLVDEGNASGILWLLERSPWLTVVFTTRRRGRFEAIGVAERIRSTVITDELLAFSAEETRDLFASVTRFSAEHALIVHAATLGHPLATRIVLTLLVQRPQSVNVPVADPATPSTLCRCGIAASGSIDRVGQHTDRSQPERR